MAEDAFGIVGTVIASAYHVESVVAQGGFGTVYRAHHGGFRAPVALKCLRLPPGLLPDAKQHFLDSFRAEAELLFRLSASIPTVVRPLHVDAFTLADGRFVPYLVLEWLEGSTLDALIRKRKRDGQAPFALKKLVRLLTPVARALERAHNFRGPDGPLSIVHRDVKPENIFVANVAGEEVVKILDFGIGKAKSMVSQVAGRISQGNPGIATFTPAYGSPEQWAPKNYGQTGPWTDVWGLALTLSEALAGHPVIGGDPAAIMGTILDPNRRPTPGNEGVIVSDEVEAVFEKALALDPRDRYPDAGVFWNELLAAGRITSGELQEVRLPRDSRAEYGGGPRVEMVERVDLPRRAVSARPPSLHSGGPVAAAKSSGLELELPPLAPTMAGPSNPSLRMPSHPTLEAVPSAGAAAPLLRPLAQSPAPYPPASSGSFEVPDLDLAPVSRPAPQRSASGMRAAVAPPILFDDLTPFDTAPGSGLDLDVPSHEIARRPSQAPPVTSIASPPPAAPTSLPPVSSHPPVINLPPSEPVPRHAFQASLRPAKDASLLQRILPGAIVFGLAILLTVLDQVYSVVTGEVFSLGPLRTSVLGGLLMVVGVAISLLRLKRQ
ncbi:MAG TPA: protein kinase [Polyangiaceae bacterium]|nr:protein kinase [Polyangiaceae bacterium]